MSATTKAYGWNGSGPTGASVDTLDSAIICFGRDDLLVSVASIPRPVAGTVWSYLKYFSLDVTVTSTTAITNRKVSVSGPIPPGTAIKWAAQKTYTQNTGTQESGPGSSTAGNYPKDDATDIISALTPATQPVAAPTNTVNGTGLGTTGQTAILVASGGTNYQQDQYLLLGANTANAEIVQINGTTTGTSIPCTATTKTHANGDVLGLAYQAMTTTPVPYDTSSVSTGSTGRNGAYLQCVFLVDSTFSGGAGNLGLPTIQLTFDEA